MIFFIHFQYVSIKATDKTPTGDIPTKPTGCISPQCHSCTSTPDRDLREYIIRLLEINWLQPILFSVYRNIFIFDLAGISQDNTVEESHTGGPSTALFLTLENILTHSLQLQLCWF